MMNVAEPVATEASIWLQLLDASHSYPVQTWKLKGKSTIHIGRSDDNEIVIHQSSVSRLHLVLNWEGNGWELVNVGRFGTIVGGQSIGQHRIDRDTTVQLGAAGPSLRLLLAGGRESHGETREHPIINMQEVNEALKQKKVAEIVESDFFQQLQKRAKQLKGKALNPEETV